MSRTTRAVSEVERSGGSAARFMEGRRARSTEQKQARAHDILFAAEDLMGEAFRLATVAEIAERAGVAKGTIYLYYATKEEVYLAVLQTRLNAWCQEMAERIEGGTGPLGRRSLSRVFLDYPMRHPITLRLAGLSSTVLEANVATDAVIAYKTSHQDWLSRLGVAAAARTRGLDHGEAAARFLRSYGYLIGTWQLCHPPPACREAFARPELRSLDLDFEAEASAGLSALWADVLPEVGA